MCSHVACAFILTEDIYVASISLPFIQIRVIRMFANGLCITFVQIYSLAGSAEEAALQHGRGFSLVPKWSYCPSLPA